jgi:hypothetical protein
MAQPRVAALSFAEQHDGNEIEPELRVAHQLQMQVWRRAVVQRLQRVQQALRVELELLALSAWRRRGEITIDAARPAGLYTSPRN